MGTEDEIHGSGRAAIIALMGRKRRKIVRIKGFPVLTLVTSARNLVSHYLAYSVGPLCTLPLHSPFLFLACVSCSGDLEVTFHLSPGVGKHCEARAKPIKSDLPAKLSTGEKKIQFSLVLNKMVQKQKKS